MKVNKGSLRFETLGQNIEGLMKQVYEAQRINTSKGTVMLKINKLFNKSGTLRRQSNEASGTQIRGERDLIGKKVSDIQTKDGMRLILDDMSSYQNMDTKKFLIIYFINNNSLYVYEDHFLRVDKEMFVNNYSEELQDQIIADNKYLNKMIERYDAAHFQKMHYLWDTYYDTIRPYLISPEKEKEIKEKIGNRPAVDQNISNVKKSMKPYITEEHWNDYNTALKELRLGAKRFQVPNIVELCEFFNTSKSDYYRNVYNSLNLLIKTHGFELLANITKENLKDVVGVDEDIEED